MYVLPVESSDPQQPHHEDELYYVVRGRARFQADSEDREVAAGDTIFVAAEVEHRFYDITEELAVLVFFAPAGELAMRCAIIPMQPDDWPAVGEIYGEGIATGNATFENRVARWGEMGEQPSQGLPLRGSCGEDGAGTVLGWAALSPVSARRVYAGVAESRSMWQQRRVGKALARLCWSPGRRVRALRNLDLQAGIFPENAASIALHKSCGFCEVGTRRRIGKLRDTWRDVLLLERRSSVAGP